MTKNLRVLIIFLAVLFISNIIWLDYKIINSEKRQELISNSTSQQSNVISTIPDLETSVSGLNSKDLSLILTYIKDATASISNDISLLKQEKNISNSTTVNNTNTVKEFYLPLGTGTTSNSEWTDISGAESYLAPSNYGKIKEMYFEASVRLPTGDGRVYARLRNVTDNVGLIESEIYLDGTQTGLVSSAKIPVPSTTKLYRVQIKSTLGAPAVLDSARIKIFVD